MGHVLVFRPGLQLLGLPVGPSAVNRPNGTPAAIAWAIIARACRGLTANCACGGFPAARHRWGSPVQDWARSALASGVPDRVIRLPARDRQTAPSWLAEG